MAYDHPNPNPHNVNSLLSPRGRSGGTGAEDPAAGAAEQEGPYASSAAYHAGDPAYQAAGTYRSPARGAEYPRYDAAYDYPTQHEAGGGEYAPSGQHYQYPYATAGQHHTHDRHAARAEYADYRDGYTRQEYNYGMPAQQQPSSQSHRSRRPVAYEYEYDQAAYEQARYADASEHRYQYHDQHRPAAAHDEYYSRQYAYANHEGYAQDAAAAGGYAHHSTGATDAGYYDRHHRYQQHQQYDYQPSAGDRSDALRSPSAQVQQQQQGQHKYSSQASATQYDYGAHAERVGSRSADPQRAAVADAASYRGQGRSDAYEQTGGRAHEQTYNLDTHLSRQQQKSHAYRYGTSEGPGYSYEHAGSAEAAQAYYQQRSPVPAAYASRSEHRSPSHGTHLQALRRDAAGYGPTYSGEAEAESHGRAHRLPGIGINSLLADPPTTHEVAYDRHRHRNYDTPPGRYGHEYEEVPGGTYPESHAVMSISQLVGGEVGAYRDEGIRNGHAHSKRPTEHAQQDPSREPILIVSDDDNEAESAGHAVSGAGRGQAEASETDDDTRPLAARPNRAIRPKPGTAEAAQSTLVPKKRRVAAASSGGVGMKSRRRRLAADANTEEAGAGDKRRHGRRARGPKKIELSREYVSDDDDDDDEEAPLELSTASLNSNGGGFPRDSSGDHDVAVPSGGAVPSTAAADEDYSVEEQVQAYIHRVKQRTDRAVAKYEEQSRRKSQRMHDHVVQRYGPYLRGYFENVGADNDYGVQRQQPPPMGYFSPPSRAMSPVRGYGRQYERDGATPESDDSGPLALLAEEGTLVQNGSPKSLWARMAVEHVPLTFFHMQANVQVRNANMQKVAELCKRESRRVLGPPAPRTAQLNAVKPMIVVRPSKDLLSRTRRSMREMLGYWKRHEKEERDMRKRAEKEAAERLKQEEDAREARRQARKLNFLITQTELYSTFVGDKIVDAAAKEAAEFDGINFDDEDEASLAALARQSAKNALALQQAQTRKFDEIQRQHRDDHASASDEPHDANVAEALDSMNFQDPDNTAGADIPQPRMLMCQLKEYQIKGLTWLAHLYEQGINGILADEMGLGKTVQSISFLAYLAETNNVWGPFMVVAPASTLHNWQQELTRFVPEFKVLPYWGTPKDRKVLRTSLNNPNSLSRRDSDFHVLVTSYQLVVQDEAYLNRVKWQYMVLDEAQAIKSSSSARWKTLLGFHCRNRLLLTGTPIQNSMQELWALLHFIMPMLFDSHDEFSDWFSRDIEAHAENRSSLNQHQLQRLHVILKPFMLRRQKRHVQNELGEKIEHLVSCDLTQRQKAMYRGLMSKVSVTDLLDRVQNGGSSSNKDEPDENLMNLVMQFRKVCSHPELFERAEVDSPYVLATYPTTGSLAREGDDLACSYATRSIVAYDMPKLLYRESLEVPRMPTQRRSVLDRLSLWTGESYVSDNNDGLLSLLRLCTPSASSAIGAFRGTLTERLDLLTEESDRVDGFRQHLLMSSEENSGSTPKLTQPGSVLHALSNVMADANLCVSSNLAGLARLTLSEFAHSYMSTIAPAFKPPAVSPPADLVVSDRSAAWESRQVLLEHPLASRLSCGRATAEDWTKPFRSQGMSDIWMPSVDNLIRYSGKMAALDQLLIKLKQENHRVLLYFQMTKTIDLFEEYLAYRKYTYLRLDGASKISDRRDMVMDWQTRDDIFIFLLSTRAGGLGINLTAADTVIFFESDWNPTVDSQAMDRAHRLGQTKQVVVYRLITRGTVEERILQRAQQKNEIHRIVIAGGDSHGESEDGSDVMVEGFSSNFEPSSKEIVSLLLGKPLDDESSAQSDRLSMARLAQETSNRLYGHCVEKYPGVCAAAWEALAEDPDSLVVLPQPLVDVYHPEPPAFAAQKAIDAGVTAQIRNAERLLAEQTSRQRSSRGRGGSAAANGSSGRGGKRGGAVPREKRKPKVKAGKDDSSVAPSPRPDTPDQLSAKRLRIEEVITDPSVAEQVAPNTIT
ncbi:putative DNA helicase ino80 [Coemansia linderi]|uniref:DNA helicase ino80 n=1 Tax=Coemansia linderi TaxID=2663919 RepID=A0ACC1KPB6_9FUNG|nr:putative DNA helicase ino80 [Coemansia linderi]